MLGLRYVFSGSAQNTLETFKEILDDLDAVQEALGRHTVSAKIVQALKNTMSDRHSAQKLFNEILTDYRSSILPSIVEGWSDMTELEREQVCRMNNFFVGYIFLWG